MLLLRVKIKINSSMLVCYILIDNITLINHRGLVYLDLLYSINLIYIQTDRLIFIIFNKRIGNFI